MIPARLIPCLFFALVLLGGCPSNNAKPPGADASRDMRAEDEAPDLPDEPSDMRPDARQSPAADMSAEVRDASADDWSARDMEEMGEPVREHLHLEMMLQGGRAPAPSTRVPLSAFAPSAGALQSDLPLTGTIRFSPSRSAIAIERDDYRRALIPDIEALPSFEVTVKATPRGELLAARPWFAATTSAVQPWWVIPGAGHVWAEPAEDGEERLRVSMPLTLVEAHANCSFHGLMTALYDKNNQTFSDAYYQFSQETCLYFKAPLWGWLEASFAPLEALSPQEEAWLGETVAARRARLPVKPLSALDALGVRTEAFLSAMTREHVTAHGVLLDGVHYRGECLTRDGEMPWCEEVVVPSYSTAKSLIAGLSYLALKEEVPGLDEVTMGQHLEDVPESWRDVSVGELLDMRSGHYESAVYMVDEGGEAMGSFFVANRDEEKYAAALAFAAQNQSPSPWVYHTSDTFLATRLMQAIIKARHASELMVWLAETIFSPLGLSVTAREAYLYTVAEGTGERQHYGGYGSFWHVDDLLRLVEDLIRQASVEPGAGAGRHDREALLGVLQRREDQRGRVHDESAQVSGNVFYFKGFWAIEVGPQDGFPCEAVIPFLSGFGGLTVAILPNDAVYYVIGDGDEFLWLDAARELATRPGFCAN